MHVAIIMDGNGRWAAARGLPRQAGHRAGARAVRRVVEAALGQRIGTLTLFAFSSENWRRPPGEVGGLMAIFGDYLRTQAPALAARGIRFRLIGRRDRLGKKLEALVREAEARTAGGAAMRLRIAIDYSGRDAILRAAAALAAGDAISGGGEGPPAGRRGAPPTREEFSRLLGAVEGEEEPAPDVDLLIRTGDERRLSDFFLWECAFAELLFLPLMWPDFSSTDLSVALDDFRSRERRFGALPGRLAL